MAGKAGVSVVPMTAFIVMKSDLFSQVNKVSKRFTVSSSGHCFKTWITKCNPLKLGFPQSK